MLYISPHFSFNYIPHVWQEFFYILHSSGTLSLFSLFFMPYLKNFCEDQNSPIHLTFFCSPETKNAGMGENSGDRRKFGIYIKRMMYVWRKYKELFIFHPTFFNHGGFDYRYPSKII